MLKLIWYVWHSNIHLTISAKSLGFLDEQYEVAYSLYNLTDPIQSESEIRGNLKEFFNKPEYEYLRDLYTLDTLYEFVTETRNCILYRVLPFSKDTINYYFEQWFVFIFTCMFQHYMFLGSTVPQWFTIPVGPWRRGFLAPSVRDPKIFWTVTDINVQ